MNQIPKHAHRGLSENGIFLHSSAAAMSTNQDPFMFTHLHTEVFFVKSPFLVFSSLDQYFQSAHADETLSPIMSFTMAVP